MDVRSRFHFLDLWDETPEREGTDEEGTVREHQTAITDASQWRSERSGSGKSLCFSTCVGSELGFFFYAGGG